MFRKNLLTTYLEVVFKLANVKYGAEPVISPLDRLTELLKAINTYRAANPVYMPFTPGTKTATQRQWEREQEEMERHNKALENIQQRLSMGSGSMTPVGTGQSTGPKFDEAYNRLKDRMKDVNGSATDSGNKRINEIMKNWNYWKQFYKGPLSAGS